MTATLGTYMRVNGLEVVNPCRISAYIKRAGSTHRPAAHWMTNPDCATCCDAAYMAANYVYPGAVETDPAPWYNSAIPESQEFFGAQFASTGTTVSADMRTRTITGVIDLVSSTERGAWYGLQWLTQALNGGMYPRAGQCGTVDLQMAVYCGTGTGPARLIPRAKLSGPLTVLKDTQPYPCEAGLQVGFVFEAQTPWLFKQGASVTTANSWATAKGMDCRLTGTVVAAVSCLDEALSRVCPPVALPTITLPSLSRCVCEPMFRNLECVKTPAIPAFSEAAAKITVTTGATESVGTQIYIWPVDAGTLCPCDPAADINAWALVAPVAVASPIVLPANSVLTIDGVSGRISLECGGEVVPAASILFGDRGAPWIHPTLGATGDTQFCVGVATDGFGSCSTPLDLEVTVELWEREL